MISDFGGFDSRKDNKLWKFITKSGNACVYVVAFTWFDARAGALVALQVSQSEVSGHQIESPKEYFIDSESVIVVVDKQLLPHITKTTRAISGMEALKL